MSQIKIIARIIGGIGNQLFSYAAARRLALTNDCELVVDDVSGFRYDRVFRRTCQLDHFSIPCRQATPPERLEPFSRPRRFLRKRLNSHREFFSRDYIVQEVFDFDERLLRFRPAVNTYIEGYWQSENYFTDISDTIREDLVIKPPADVANLAMARDINSRNAVAVHFRYFSPHDNSPDNLGMAYYERAYDRIMANVPDPHFYIFSDNPAMAAGTLSIPPDRLTVITHNRGGDMAFADLWLMQQCRHFIIANSTFSWWGAWLATHPDKVVIAPGMEKRTGESWWGFKGLLPPAWVLL